MLTKLRTYGFLIFLVPFCIYWLDDYLTQWHEHGQESVRRILLENLAEDIVFAIGALIYGKWEMAQTASVHCTCPNCHFQWMMHPKQVMLLCPRCHRPEHG